MKDATNEVERKLVKYFKRIGATNVKRTAGGRHVRFNFTYDDVSLTLFYSGTDDTNVYKSLVRDIKQTIHARTGKQLDVAA